ncbi:MAG TPA: hypothetical protein VN716_19030 [Vicinamibacterales bacterium]|nr:hypothetical protein [Vicinamibacterales bacterium]
MNAFQFQPSPGPRLLQTYLDLVPFVRSLGYMLTVVDDPRKHLVLLATPWVAGAGDAEDLAVAVRNHVCGFFADDRPVPEVVAHGRKCWTILLAGAPLIELSVMPCERSAS